MYVFLDGGDDFQVQICYVSSYKRGFCGKPTTLHPVSESEAYSIQVRKPYRSSDLSFLVYSSQEVTKISYTFDFSANDLSVRQVGTKFTIKFDQEITNFDTAYDAFDLGNSILVVGATTDKKLQMVRVWTQNSNYVSIPTILPSEGVLLVGRDQLFEKKIDVASFGVDSYQIFGMDSPTIFIKGLAGTEAPDCRVIATFTDDSEEGVRISYSTLKTTTSNPQISTYRKIFGYNGIKLKVPIFTKNFKANNPAITYTVSPPDSSNVTMYYSDSYKVNDEDQLASGEPSLSQRRVLAEQQKLGQPASQNKGNSGLLWLGEQFYLRYDPKTFSYDLLYLTRDVGYDSRVSVSMLTIGTISLEEYTPNFAPAKLLAATFDSQTLVAIFDVRDKEGNPDQENGISNTLIFTLDIIDLEASKPRVQRVKNILQHADVRIRRDLVMMVGIENIAEANKIVFSEYSFVEGADNQFNQFYEIQRIDTFQKFCPSNLKFGPIDSNSIFVLSQCTEEASAEFEHESVIFWLGMVEGSAGHLKVLDTYNTEFIAGSEFCVTSSHIHIVKQELETSDLEVIAFNLDQSDVSKYSYPLKQYGSFKTLESMVCDPNSDMFHILVNNKALNAKTSKTVVSFWGDASSGANNRVHSVSNVADFVDSIAAGSSSSEPHSIVVLGNTEVIDLERAIVLQVEGPIFQVTRGKMEDSDALGVSLSISVKTGDDDVAQGLTDIDFEQFNGEAGISLKKTCNPRKLDSADPNVVSGTFNLEECAQITGTVRSIELNSPGSVGIKNQIGQRIKVISTLDFKEKFDLLGSAISKDQDFMFMWGNGYVAVQRPGNQIYKFTLKGRFILKAEIVLLEDFTIPTLVMVTQLQSGFNQIEALYPAQGTYESFTLTESNIAMESNLQGFQIGALKSLGGSVFQTISYSNHGIPKLVMDVFTLDDGKSEISKKFKTHTRFFEQKISTFSSVNFGSEYQITTVILANDIFVNFSLDGYNSKDGISELASQRATFSGDKDLAFPMDFSTSKLSCALMNINVESPSIKCFLAGSDKSSLIASVTFNEFKTVLQKVDPQPLVVTLLSKVLSVFLNVPGFVPQTVKFSGSYIVITSKASTILSTGDNVNFKPNPLSQQFLVQVFNQGQSYLEYPFAIITGDELGISTYSDGYTPSLYSVDEVPGLLFLGNQRTNQIVTYELNQFSFNYENYKNIDIQQDTFTLKSYTNAKKPITEVPLSTLLLQNYTPTKDTESIRRSAEVERRASEKQRLETEYEIASKDSVRVAAFEGYNRTLTNATTKIGGLYDKLENGDLEDKLKESLNTLVAQSDSIVDEIKKDELKDIASNIVSQFSSIRNTADTTSPEVDAVGVSITKSQNDFTDYKASDNKDRQSVETSQNQLKTDLSSAQVAVNDVDSKVGIIRTKIDSKVSEGISSEVEPIQTSIEKVFQGIEVQKSSVGSANSSHNVNSISYDNFVKDITTKKDTIGKLRVDITQKLAVTTENTKSLTTNLKETIQGLIEGDLAKLQKSVSAEQALLNSNKEIKTDFDNETGVTVKKSSKDIVSSQERFSGQLATYQKAVADFQVNFEAGKKTIEDGFSQVEEGFVKGDEKVTSYKIQMIIMFIAIAILIILILVLVCVAGYLFVQLSGLKREMMSAYPILTDEEINKVIKGTGNQSSTEAPTDSATESKD